MTIDEINNLKTLSFQELWEKLWMKTIKQDNYRIDYKKNYENALNKFNKIKESGLLTKFINNYSGSWTEPEWGLPKGRKNFDESNIQTAIREFTEETNINNNYFIILNSKEFVEDYIGSDNKRYKHIYYLAQSKNQNIKLEIDPKNRSQITEISSLHFFSLTECLSKIRDYNTEKKKSAK